MTIAVNNGYSIARSEKARASWNAAQATSRPQTVREYRATAARLSQRLPGVVRVN
jgi:hypothetical protein